MKILVLGSGAGGGYPQWNCNCERCGGLRRGTIRAHPRTQSSIAVSDGTGQWVLLNASPDIGHQLRSNPALHPRDGKRDTPIKAVILMDAQLDHVVGLLSLREGPPIELYCTPCVFEELTGGLPILPILQHYCGIRWHLLAVAGETTTVEFRLEALPEAALQRHRHPGQGAALFRAPRRPVGRRQPRLADRRPGERRAGVLCARPVAGRQGRASVDEAGELHHGGRDLLERARDGRCRPRPQERIRHGAPAAGRPRRHDRGAARG